MKALVVGYGSIGARHARLLTGLGADVAVVSRRALAAPKVYPTVARAVGDFAPDYAVIASRTDEHRDDMAALAEAGFEGRLLVEKPLFDRPAALPANRFRSVHVAYQLRFHPVVRRLKALLDATEPFAVHAVVGQDPRQWPLTAAYRDNFRARADQGGGVLRDLSHELDYLTWILGRWTRLTAAGGHVSGLDGDSDDVFSLLFATERCPVVTLNMNYLDSSLRRQVLALTDRGTIVADLAAGTVSIDGRIETFAVERDDVLIAQHKAALAGEGDTLCAADEGLAVVDMIAAAERASAEREWAAA